MLLGAFDFAALLPGPAARAAGGVDLVNGRRTADDKGTFSNVVVPVESTGNKVGYVLTQTIKDYQVSHAHLDRVGGLIVASPDDTKKPIYALASVNTALRDTYCNWPAWPKFGDRGKAPQIEKYALTHEQPQEEMMDELQPQNDLGVCFILPEQGTRWHFK
jgi:cAMP phosphodiesterase